MRAFHVIAKPAGPLCNLRCRYCFYVEKESLFPETTDWRMDEGVLEAFIRQYICDQDAPAVSFTWQGGEPTVLGVDFFRRVVEMQARHAGAKVVRNSFQTNGILLDDEWCAFLAQAGFLVGLSLDGPREVHDRWRVDRGGAPTFERAMRGLTLLKRHRVEFNVLTCVHSESAERPLDVYRFLRETGAVFLQFIPIVERDSSSAGRLAPWSLLPEQLGRFLCSVFEEWVRRDVGRIFVQSFDVALESWLGREPSLCVARPTCGKALVVEHNGDVFSCDHFVSAENRLGNLRRESLGEMCDSAVQRRFGEAKADLPSRCRSCGVRFACHGGCPKDRLAPERPGEAPLHHLCPSFATFFGHIDPYMRFMAAELESGRPAANVMAWARSRPFAGVAKTRPAREAFCPCGSGRRYRRCCGR